MEENLQSTLIAKLTKEGELLVYNSNIVSIFDNDVVSLIDFDVNKIEWWIKKDEKRDKL